MMDDHVATTASRLTYIARDLSLVPKEERRALFVERVKTVGEMVRDGLLNAATVYQSLWDIALAHRLLPDSDIADVINNAVALTDEQGQEWRRRWRLLMKDNVEDAATRAEWFLYSLPCVLVGMPVKDRVHKLRWFVEALQPHLKYLDPDRAAPLMIAIASQMCAAGTADEIKEIVRQATMSDRRCTSSGRRQ
jgi:hypothetical protein